MALNCSEELTTIPGLIPLLIEQHLLCLPATDKGHMYCHRSHTASTRNMQDNIVTACAKVDQIAQPRSLCHTRCALFCPTCGCNHWHNVYQHRRCLPCPLVQKYAVNFCCLVYDLNAITVRAMPSCTNARMVQAFTSMITILKSQGYQPVLNMMDN